MRRVTSSPWGSRSPCGWRVARRRCRFPLAAPRRARWCVPPCRPKSARRVVNWKFLRDGDGDWPPEASWWPTQRGSGSQDTTRGPSLRSAFWQAGGRASSDVDSRSHEHLSEKKQGPPKRPVRCDRNCRAYCFQQRQTISKVNCPRTGIFFVHQYFRWISGDKIGQDGRSQLRLSHTFLNVHHSYVRVPPEHVHTELGK